jgi:hypothetical protein
LLDYCVLHSKTEFLEETDKVCEDLDALYAKGNFSLTGMDWMNINEFAKKVNKKEYSYNYLWDEYTYLQLFELDAVLS